MKVIIAGSRSITSMDHVKEAIKRSGFVITEVVSGMAEGPDKLGKQWAEENGIHVEEKPADWKNHPKLGGYIRNTEMAHYAQALIAVWDGKSGGTKHMILEMKQQGKPYYVFKPGVTDVTENLRNFITEVHESAYNELISSLYPETQMKTPNEIWPFIDHSSNQKIKEDVFYGFSDAGGTASSEVEFKSSQEAVDYLTELYEFQAEDMSTDPNDLGNVACCVLSGRQFIDKLRLINTTEGELEFGEWSQPNE